MKGLRYPVTRVIMQVTYGVVLVHTIVVGGTIGVLINYISQVEAYFADKVWLPLWF